MEDVIFLILETILYFMYWVVLGSDLPSLLEIIVYSITVEILKICVLSESPTGDNLSGFGFAEVQENSTLDNVSVVNSSSKLNVCQAPDLKECVTPKRSISILNPLKQTKSDMVPIVHSEVVYSFCMALDLKAILVPVDNRVVFSPQKHSTKYNVTPVVHSEVVYSICLGLGLNAKLAPQKHDC
ncbi:hypothetical protein NPIL_8201 [Nephila pilipes]|uniref:Uncharacterized protein n=1 Tax=Nephila pilipes TaxID=299642 RepID=A0A8X6QEL8_NEPPI|nr:hypothetical protein NPIL_8201 [Nephila pilipes]